MKTCALYRIIHRETMATYIGTSVDPVRRWKTHRKRARQGEGSKLYELIRQRGLDDFFFQVVSWFPSVEEARLAEALVISYGLADLNTRKG